MKRGLILVLVLLLLPIAEARTKTLSFQKGQSEIVKDVNITLLDLNKKDEKVIICANNEKGIVSEELGRRMEGVYFELKDVTNLVAKLEIEVDCDNCQAEDNLDCYDECLNNESCDDNDKNTLDYCTGRPKKCVHNKKVVIPKTEEENKTLEENKTIEEERVLEENKTQEIGKEIKYEGLLKKIVAWVIKGLR